MMKEDGRFLFGDIIRKTEVAEVEKMFTENGLKIVEAETVNEGVINSIETHSTKQYPLATKFPFLFPRRIHSFFVTIHSRAYKRLKSREVLYNLYLLKKN